MKTLNRDSIQLDGINTRDYPDFCDAFISYAEYNNGTPLNDQELDALNDNEPDLVYELVMDYLF